MGIRHVLCLFFSLLCLASCLPSDASSSISVWPSKHLHQRSPLLFGAFFEEINHAGVGGLYGELIYNRAFEDPSTPLATKAPAKMVSLSYGTSSQYLRHCNFVGFVSQILDKQDDEDSSFIQHPGLASNLNGYVSFEAPLWPNYFLVASNQGGKSYLMLVQTDHSAAFNQSATFRMVQGLADPNAISLQLYSNRSSYIYASPVNNGQCQNLWDEGNTLSLLTGTPPSNSAATFRLSSPNYASPPSWFFISDSAGRGNITLDKTMPLNSASNTSLRLDVSAVGAGVANSGYWGIKLAPYTTYNVTFFARANPTFVNNKGAIIISLESMDGTQVYATQKISTALTSSWAYYGLGLTTSNVQESNARFSIRTSAVGSVWFDVVSVFPPTYKGRANGLRADLAQRVADMKPTFMRFPGGCYVEGDKLVDAFRWKNSIGPISERPGHWNLWGYWSEDGLGMLEYLTFIEDIGASPVYVTNIGISHTDYIPTASLQPWIQDALDALQFANGPASTQWGALRAKFGHPQPFNISIVALGNEDCGKFGVYNQNYEAFASAIRKQYPNILFIANCELSGVPMVDIFDYHIYSNDDWFYNNVHAFDKQDRNGAHVFVSEYAVTQGSGKGNLGAALAEAAFTTGLVINSDIVMLASYAPLFTNVYDRTWNPDAIQFNSTAVAPTPSYWVQLLFSQHTGDVVVPVQVTSSNNTLFACATLYSRTNSISLAVINRAQAAVDVSFDLVDQNKLSGNVTVVTLSSGSLLDENSLDLPDQVAPKTSSFKTQSSPFTYNIEGYSLTFMIMPL